MAEITTFSGKNPLGSTNIFYLFYGSGSNRMLYSIQNKPVLKLAVAADPEKELLFCHIPQAAFNSGK